MTYHPKLEYLGCDVPIGSFCVSATNVASRRLFCAAEEGGCPDRVNIPEGCTATCQPELQRWGGCALECPCKSGSSARLAAYSEWFAKYAARQAKEAEQDAPVKRLRELAENVEQSESDRFCADCSAPISHGRTRCRPCANRENARRREMARAAA